MSEIFLSHKGGEAFKQEKEMVSDLSFSDSMLHLNTLIVQTFNKNKTTWSAVSSSSQEHN